VSEKEKGKDGCGDGSTELVRLLARGDVVRKKPQREGSGLEAAQGLAQQARREGGHGDMGRDLFFLVRPLLRLAPVSKSAGPPQALAEIARMADDLEQLSDARAQRKRDVAAFRWRGGATWTWKFFLGSMTGGEGERIPVGEGGASGDHRRGDYD